QLAFHEVQSLDQAKITEAIGMVGKTAVDLPQVGRLVAKGLALVTQVLDKLTKLLGPGNVGALQEKAREVIKKLEQGASVLDEFLIYSYGVAKAKEYLQLRLKETSADISKIDHGVERLTALQTAFAEQMAITARIVKGLNWTKGLAG